MLTQHAQKDHGIKIYVDDVEPTILPPIDTRTPGVPLPSPLSSSLLPGPLTGGHPSLPLLRMPPAFLAAMAAASRPTGPGSNPSQSDIFSANPSSLVNQLPVSLFEPHNIFTG